MNHHTFHHLGRDWEAAILASRDETAPVRFRHADDDDPRTYEGSLEPEDLDPNGQDRELALRNALEACLVLDALAGQEGLTAQEVADRAGMPLEATEDRLRALDGVEPVLHPLGTRRWRITGT